MHVLSILATTASSWAAQRVSDHIRIENHFDEHIFFFFYRITKFAVRLPSCTFPNKKNGQIVRVYAFKRIHEPGQLSCIPLHYFAQRMVGKQFWKICTSSSRNTPITAACIQKIRKSSYISNNDGKSSTVDDHQWWRLKKKHPFGTSKIDFHVCVFFLLAFSRNCWPTALSLSMVYVGSFLTQCFGFSAIILLIVCIIPIFFRPFSDTHAIRLAFFSDRPFPTCMFLALTHWSQLAVFVEEKMCIKSMINIETVWTCMNGHTLHASVYWWSWPKKGAWVSVSLATFFDRTATTTTAEQKISGKILAIFSTFQTKHSQ